jgi:hypothetical protein
MKQGKKASKNWKREPNKKCSLGEVENGLRKKGRKCNIKANKKLSKKVGIGGDGDLIERAKKMMGKKVEQRKKQERKIFNKYQRSRVKL